MSAQRVGARWAHIVLAFISTPVCAQDIARAGPSPLFAVPSVSATDASHSNAAHPASRPRYARATHVMPLDLVSNQTDINGLLLNPHWQEPFPDVGALCDVHSDPTLTHCTSQTVTLNFANNTFVNAGCNMSSDLLLPDPVGGHMAGHKNWFPVTMTGSVVLERGYDEGGSALIGWDADMDFSLTPSDSGALTKSSVRDKGGNIELEWDGYEVFYWQADPSSWWNRFFSNKNNDSAKVMVNPDHPRAPIGRNDDVIIGLLGLDCRHWCHTELHPVYAMALHTKSDESDDHWAVMARNSGNEGSCGSNVVETPMQTMSMVLHHPYAQHRQVISSDISGHAGRYDDGAVPLFPPAVGWWISDVVNPGTANANVVVTFVLPPPATRATIFGDFTLEWTQAQMITRCTTTVCADVSRQAVRRSSNQGPTGKSPSSPDPRNPNQNAARGPVTVAGTVLQPHVLNGDDDEHIMMLVRNMTPAQRQRFDASVPPAPSRVASAKPSSAVQPDPKLKPARVADVTRVVRYEPDLKREQARQQLMQAICTAYDGRVPNFPSLCRK